jgi:hypothetical protein
MYFPVILGWIEVANVIDHIGEKTGASQGLADFVLKQRRVVAATDSVLPALRCWQLQCTFTHMHVQPSTVSSRIKHQLQGHCQLLHMMTCRLRLTTWVHLAHTCCIAPTGITLVHTNHTSVTGTQRQPSCTTFCNTQPCMHSTCRMWRPWVVTTQTLQNECDKSCWAHRACTFQPIPSTTSLSMQATTPAQVLLRQCKSILQIPSHLSQDIKALDNRRQQRILKR